MKVVIDIEANSLVNPDKIWVIVCKDIDTGKYYVFRNVTTDENEALAFHHFAGLVETWIGHNLLGYDYPVLRRLGIMGDIPIAEHSIDTLIVSKLVDYPRKGHSIEDYGLEFGFEKLKFTDFSKYSPEMEEYCKRDVDICHKIYTKYLKYISKEEHKPSILLEHRFQLEVVNSLSNNGFYFNSNKAKNLLDSVTNELSILDKDILEAFPPRLKLVREIHPKETKYGTLHRGDFRWVLDGDLSQFNGGPFCRCSWVEFNPASHPQLIDILTESAWEPVDKTATHLDTERRVREIERAIRRGEDGLDIELSQCYDKLKKLAKYGWKINENNLATLPENAPRPARLLAQRILLESRRRTLTEWLDLVQEDNRIHGKFYGIGAWTHRMAHQNPNTANIPTEAKLHGAEMRALWRAPPNRLLVGVDAEGIQLRIFAHYINDEEFTESLVRGKKAKKTDPHSLNQRILGSVCRSRQDAKRFIYALLLGAGLRKLAEILGASESETQEALDRLLERYTGWKYLKEEVIPKDARRGWFSGLDGRAVRIPGDTIGQRKHLCTSGYLQNGEAVCMKAACLRWLKETEDDPKLRRMFSERSRLFAERPEGPIASGKIKLVNFVHDEWQTETPNDMAIALRVAEIKSDSLRKVGEELGLRCPLAGSYWNDDRNDYTIGTNWYQTH